MLTTKKSELIKAFKAGLKTGDTILIHSSIFSLGRLQDGLDTLIIRSGILLAQRETSLCQILLTLLDEKNFTFINHKVANQLAFFQNF